MARNILHLPPVELEFQMFVMDELADLKKRFERLKLLYDVSNTIHSSLDAQEALQLIVDEAVRLTQASSASSIASWKAGRTVLILSDVPFGQVRLVSKVTESWRSGSIHREVPV